MGKTNRQHSDVKLLHAMTDEGFGLLDAEIVDSEVTYSPPAENALSIATVQVTIQWQVGQALADKILDAARG